MFDNSLGKAGNEKKAQFKNIQQKFMIPELK